MGEGVILYPATGTSEVLDGCGLTDSVVGRQARTRIDKRKRNSSD